MLQGMPYPGGKAGQGTFQKIINLMPPHEAYIEPFLGDAAVMRVKRPARLNIGLDLDSASPGLAWLDSFAENGAATGLAEQPCCIAGSSGKRRHPSPVMAGGSAGGLDNSSGDLEPLSPDLARSAVRAGNGEDRSTIAGNGEASSFRAGCLDGIEFLRVYPFTGRELVYCDPPYLMSTRSGRSYYKFELSDVDHRRLLRVVRKIQCMVMLSGYKSDLYSEELRGWNSIHFEAMTRGGLRTEWLWFNFPVPNVLHDARFIGEGFRERERLKKMKVRWVARLRSMPLLDRQALLSAIASVEQ